jgi:hypothetical protein
MRSHSKGKAVSSTKIQRRMLERAFDCGADRHEVALAIEAMRTGQVNLIVMITARRLSIRAAARAGRNGKQT